MVRFLGAFPASLTFFVSTTSLIGSIWIPALWGHIFTTTTSLSWNGRFHAEPSPESRKWGDLCLCGGLDIPSWQKLHWFMTFHISIWWDFELCFGG